MLLASFQVASPLPTITIEGEKRETPLTLTRQSKLSSHWPVIKGNARFCRTQKKKRIASIKKACITPPYQREYDREEKKRRSLSHCGGSCKKKKRKTSIAGSSHDATMADICWMTILRLLLILFIMKERKKKIAIGTIEWKPATQTVQPESETNVEKKTLLGNDKLKYKHTHTHTSTHLTDWETEN